ncbi:MAG TPA: hypothetical protein VFS43_38375 [Polyangiaceae bacterium]|nr:hypothetical protein [Polyangiaceae bacterium]
MSPDALARELLRLGAEAPAACVEAVRETGLELQGRLVQEEIAGTTPHQPVDQSQYKGSWRGTPTEAGFLVYNLAKHAVWVERGRRPGGKPGGIYRHILPWAKRHGLDAGAAWAIAVKISRRGYKPRWVLKRANERARPILRARVARALSRHLSKA